jgi:hypothetical protein
MADSRKDCDAILQKLGWVHAVYYIYQGMRSISPSPCRNNTKSSTNIHITQSWHAPRARAQALRSPQRGLKCSNGKDGPSCCAESSFLASLYRSVLPPPPSLTLFHRPFSPLRLRLPCPEGLLSVPLPPHSQVPLPSLSGLAPSHDRRAPAPSIAPFRWISALYRLTWLRAENDE